MTKYIQDGPPRTKILRRPKVQERTGLSKSSLYGKVAADEFPKPVKLGPRAVGWIESEIEDWLARQIESSRQTFAEERPVKNGRHAAGRRSTKGGSRRRERSAPPVAPPEADRISDDDAVGPPTASIQSTGEKRS